MSLAPSFTASFASVTSPESLLEALQARGRLPLRLGKDAADSSVGLGADASIDDLLAHHWLVPGGVVELSSLPGAGAWSLGFVLAAIARKQARAIEAPRWIGAVDPWGTLSPVALAHLLHDDSAGDDADLDALNETLVVRPSTKHDDDAILRTATRMARSRACAAIVVDAAGLHDVSGAVLGMRRLGLAAEESGCAVIVVTSLSARRAQPLPVAARGVVDVDVRSGGAVLTPLRHRHGMPPKLTVPRQRLDRSVTAMLVAEQEALRKGFAAIAANDVDVVADSSTDS
ncbi:MAG TPA: hypothetical protein VGF99_02490, partial [Myxococcota bacterium]